MVDKLIALGVISILDLDDVGTEPLVKDLKIDSALAEKLVAAAGEEAKRLAAESKPKKIQEILQQEEQQQPETKVQEIIQQEEQQPQAETTDSEK